MTEKKFSLFLYMIVKRIIPFIMEEEQISEQDAIVKFYNSKTYELLADEQTKYWWFSAEALYEDYILRKKEDGDV